MKRFNPLTLRLAAGVALGQSFLAAALAGSDEILDRSCARDDTKNELPAAQRSFAQPTACLHMPAKLTPEPTKHEGRKPRASERHAVGCCEELCRGACQRQPTSRFSEINMLPAFAFAVKRGTNK